MSAKAIPVIPMLHVSTIMAPLSALVMMATLEMGLTAQVNGSR